MTNISIKAMKNSEEKVFGVGIIFTKCPLWNEYFTESIYQINRKKTNPPHFYNKREIYKLYCVEFCNAEYPNWMEKHIK